MIPDIELCRMSGQVYDDALISGSVAELEYQIIPRDDEVVIAVRGTEISCWRDVLRDLWAVPRYHQSLGWGHGGFIRGAVALYDDLVPKLSKEVPLVMTGHSLGAIESLMLAVLLQVAGCIVRRWVGFGTPRGFLFDSDMKLSFPGRGYIHKGDIVTMIPTAPFRLPTGIEFVHLGTRWRPSVIDHNITDGYLANMA